jgi:hypothetical protein
MGKRRSLKPGGKDEPSDDEDDYEETSEPLKPAQIEEIQSRKKLTAKRRINDSSSNSTKLNPFSSFGGFKATPTPSTTLITSSITPISQNGASSSSTSIAIDNNKQNENDSTINETEVNFIQELNKLYEKYYGNKRDYKIPSHLIDKNESDKTNYAQLLMELNKRCSKWISKHVEESPFIYLTPIFIDYFNYLIQLEKEFFPNTLFTKTENGIHKKTNPLLLNGTKPTTTIETPPPTVTNTILKQVEEVSTTNSIKFPSFNNTTAFKFSPIPLTTTTKTTASTTTPPIVAAPLTTTTTPKLDFFGTSSPSTSFKFGQTTESVTKPLVETTTTPSVNKPLVETTTSFFNKPTTLIENKKDETESAQLKFSFGNTNNTQKTSPIITTTTPATTSSFSLTTSPFASNPKVPPISSQLPTNPSPLSLFSSTQSTNLFSTQQPVSTTSSLFSSTQSPSSSLFSFSQTTATKTSTDTSTTPQKGGLFSSLLSANQSTTNDSSKPFSFGNLPPSTSLFGSGVSSFGFASQQTKPQSNSEAGGDGEGGGDDGM